MEFVREPSQQGVDRRAGVDRDPAAWLRFRTCEVSLHRWWRRAIFGLLVLGGMVFLGGEAVRSAYVALLSESLVEAKLRTAIALDPANAELYHRLGIVLCTSLGDARQAEGLSDLKRATQLNPYLATYWMDLAWVCEMAGETPCAIQGVANAVKLGPNVPQYRWVAANTYLRLGRTDAAAAEFRRLLELDPSYAPATFHLCLGTLQNPQFIEREILPVAKDPGLKLAFLEFLSTNALLDQAHQVWQSIVDTRVRFAASRAMPYIENLLQAGRVDQAHDAWRDLEYLGVIPKPAADEANNMVFNGDFKHVPLNAGFDWRNPVAPYLALDFSDTTSQSGKLCLRVDFTVSRNEEYMPLYQLVAVAPRHSYLLTASVRSQDITSDSGPRLQVADAYRPQPAMAMSESTVGVTPWHQIKLPFCTGPDTRLVRVALFRARGRTFPTEITGSFWLDNVAVVPDDSNTCKSPGL